MVLVILNVDASKMPNVSQHIPEIRKKGLNYTAQGMLRHLKRNSPVDHGHLKGWYSENISDSEVEIKTPAEYAKFVNDGTGIYNGGSIIRPKNGSSVLVFTPSKKWKGPVVQRGKLKGKVVLRYSKGQKGQHFVEKSIEDTRGKLGEFFIKAIQEVL